MVAAPVRFVTIAGIGVVVFAAGVTTTGKVVEIMMGALLVT